MAGDDGEYSGPVSLARKSAMPERPLWERMPISPRLTATTLEGTS